MNANNRRTRSIDMALRRPSAIARYVVCTVASMMLSALPAAEPFTPASDDTVVARVPARQSGAAWRELRALREQLVRTPDDLKLALHLAARFSELGRTTGDPRYSGYAQSVLEPWWELPAPPHAVRVLRAVLLQRTHQFDRALEDLDAVLLLDGGNMQARLTRATIHQVKGNPAAARADCAALKGLSEAIIKTRCLATVDGVSGRLRAGYDALSNALQATPPASPAIEVWVRSALADMAERIGLKDAAETHYRAAIALDGDDFHVLGAFADYLLREHRPREASDLLADHTGSDPLMLRYALALVAQGSPDALAAVADLGRRFEASARRGDNAHLRGKGRYALALQNDPATALRLARENWSTQREPADVRLLIQAAAAAQDAKTMADVIRWGTQSHYEDVTLAAYSSVFLPD